MRKFYKLKILLITIYIIFMFSLFLSTKWLEKNFKGISFNEIVFHLKMPLQGVPKNLFTSYLNYVLILILIFLTIYIFFLFIVSNFRIILKLSGKKYIINKFILKYTFLFIIFISIIIFLLSLDSLVMNYHFDNYIQSYFKTTNIYKNEYINPDDIKLIFPEKKRNLIIIFLESMETTFLSLDKGGYFKEDIIPELYILAKDNINFSHNNNIGGALQVAGTGWTIAGIIAHLSGIPLLLPFYGNAYEGYEFFLKKAISLTDILAKAGYEQIFMIGSDKKFAGRDIYFKTHGNVIIKDLLYYKSIGKLHSDYWVWWGFEDAKLYDFAKEELNELSKESKPFNLILLTADTHHIGGYFCQLCKNEFDDQYKNVLRCASKQVYQFVKWVQLQKWYEKTTIVIVGDHLYMDSSFIPLGAKRNIYNVFINSVKKPLKEKNRIFCSFDIFPSILDSIGVEFDVPGLALGRSLFKETQTLLEKYGEEYFNREIIKRSKEYEKFLYGK